MPKMQPTYLNKHEKGFRRVSVCVRVMREWTFKENMGLGGPLYVGPVLADAMVRFTQSPQPYSLPSELILCRNHIALLFRHMDQIPLPDKNIYQTILLHCSLSSYNMIICSETQYMLRFHGK